MTARAAVAVVGPGDTDDPDLLTAAERVGAGLAAAGYLVVTGGLGGVMAAAARGARAAGGLSLGLLPGDRASDAAPDVDIAVPTGMGEARDVLVVRAAAAVVAVGGSWGTLAEIALARRHGTPVVSLHGWAVAGPPSADGPVRVGSAEEAVAAVRRLLG